MVTINRQIEKAYHCPSFNPFNPGSDIRLTKGLWKPPSSPLKGEEGAWGLMRGITRVEERGVMRAKID